MRLTSTSAVLLLAGCLSLGESAARLRGELVLPDARPSCFMELLAEGIEVDARELSTRRFEETFVLPRGRRDYEVVIRCDGVSGTWRSDKIELGDIAGYRRGVDLGAIEFGAVPDAE